jgi:7-cyano-7-deazaguanine synthase
MRREIGTDSAAPHLVLLSGGIDSSAVLALTLEVGTSASALFVDYGQAAASSEAKASAAIAGHFGVEYQSLTCTGQTFGAGEIRGRNAFLVHTALMVLRQTKAVVVLGIHAGTTYRDCSPSFLELMQRSYDFHTGGQVSLAAPLVDQVKGDVVRLASEMGVPVELTYSCEAANEPCGKCLSCRDREELLARP